MGRRRLGRGPGVALAAVVVLAVACGGGGGGGGGDDGPSGDDEWVEDVRDAVAAVEDARGGPQEYFEVTATPQLTNVFVATDGGTTVVAYAYLDGELQAPAPPDEASGRTFGAEAIAFDEDRVLATIREELPEASVDALSVEGGPGGRVRYVAAVRSTAGGALDVVVGADGSILSVETL